MADSGSVSSADRPSAASEHASLRSPTSSRACPPPSTKPSANLPLCEATPNNGGAVAGANTVKTDTAVKGNATISPSATVRASATATDATSSACAGKKSSSGAVTPAGSQKSASGGKHGGATSCRGVSGGGTGLSWKNGTSCHSSQTPSGSSGSTAQSNPKANLPSGGQNHKHGTDGSHAGGSSAAGKKAPSGFNSELSARELRKIKYYEEMFAKLANEERQKQGGTPSGPTAAGATGVSSSSASGSLEKPSKKGGPHRGGEATGGVSGKVSAPGAGRSDDGLESQSERRNSTASSSALQQSFTSQSSAPSTSSSRGSGGGATKRKHNRVIDSTDDEGPPASPPRASANKRLALARGSSVKEPAVQAPGGSCAVSSARPATSASGGVADPQRKGEKQFNRHAGGPVPAEPCRGDSQGSRVTGKSDAGAGPRHVSKDLPQSSKPSHLPRPHGSSSNTGKGSHNQSLHSGVGVNAAVPARSAPKGQGSDWAWRGRGHGGEGAKKKQRATVAVSSCARRGDDDSSSSSSSGSSSSSSSGSSDSSEGESGCPRSKISRSKDPSRGSDSVGPNGNATRAGGKRGAHAVHQCKRHQASFPGGAVSLGAAEDCSRRTDASGSTSGSSAYNSDKKGAGSASQLQGGEAHKKSAGSNVSRPSSSAAVPSSSGAASAASLSKSASHHPHRPASTTTPADENSAPEAGLRDGTEPRGGPVASSGDGACGGGAKTEKKAALAVDETGRKLSASADSGRGSAASSNRSSVGGHAGPGGESNTRLIHTDTHSGRAGEATPPGSRTVSKGEKKERGGASRTSSVSVKHEEGRQGGEEAAVFGGRLGERGVSPAHQIHEKNPWTTPGTAVESRSFSRDIPTNGDAGGGGRRAFDAAAEVPDHQSSSPPGRDSLLTCKAGGSPRRSSGAQAKGHAPATQLRNASPGAAIGCEGRHRGTAHGGSGKVIGKGAFDTAGPGDKEGKMAASAVSAEMTTTERPDGSVKGTALARPGGTRRANFAHGETSGAAAAEIFLSEEPGGHSQLLVSVKRGGSGEPAGGKNQVSAADVDSAGNVRQARPGKKAEGIRQESCGRAGRDAEGGMRTVGNHRGMGGQSSGRGAVKQLHSVDEKAAGEATKRESRGTFLEASGTTAESRQPAAPSAVGGRAPPARGSAHERVSSASGSGEGATDRPVGLDQQPTIPLEGLTSPELPVQASRKELTASYSMRSTSPQSEELGVGEGRPVDGSDSASSGSYRHCPDGCSSLPSSSQHGVQLPHTFVAARDDLGDDESRPSAPLPLLAVARSLASQPLTSTPLPPVSSRHAPRADTQLAIRQSGDVAGRCPVSLPALTEPATSQLVTTASRHGIRELHTAIGDTQKKTTSNVATGTGRTIEMEPAFGFDNRLDPHAPSTVTTGLGASRVNYQLVDECDSGAKVPRGQTECKGAQSGGEPGMVRSTTVLSASNKEYAEACCNVVPTRDWRQLLLGKSGDGSNGGFWEDDSACARTAKSAPASAGNAVASANSCSDKAPSSSSAESSAELKRGLSCGGQVNGSAAAVTRGGEPSSLPLQGGVAQPLPLSGRWVTSLSWKAQLLRKVYNAGRS
ncbi:hypothetical protein BESB_008790 [Besnoitia besnoiti]|uniref:Uncharacterized protein n=1 Tax=Besnoitia besnoiti TaxID=94643 RepID=A0A2A9MQK6_BESBE|nr:hypothetical protein BESB_008790 [Besnoitia besnoiti]PFH38537.1 hypothetical protein BESB_008790 [Besnoitia besnoiti]